MTTPTTTKITRLTIVGGEKILAEVNPLRHVLKNYVTDKIFHCATAEDLDEIIGAIGDTLTKLKTIAKQEKQI